MNILNIAIKEIKHNIRDVRTFIFMLAFPIVLMLILGTALSNAFDAKVSVNNIHVVYKSTADSLVTSYFRSFIKNAEKSGVHFKELPSDLDGKQEVKENNVEAYMELTNTGIRLYGSDRNSIEESIVQGMVTAFADKYNVAAAVTNVDSGKVIAALAYSPHNVFIMDKSLKAAKQPGSMDYYAMAMSTMIALYAALGASMLIRGERTRNTSVRLLIAPISRGEIFLGKIIGNVVLNVICILIVVAFSAIAFKANWGKHFGIIFLVLVTEIFFAVSFGVGISYIAKTGEASRAVIMIVIQLASFFGGTYFKIENPKGILNIVTSLSPLSWANNAITKIIYLNDFIPAVRTISLNLGMAFIFLCITIILLRRREGL